MTVVMAVGLAGVSAPQAEAITAHQTKLCKYPTGPAGYYMTKSGIIFSAVRDPLCGSSLYEPVRLRHRLI